MNNQLSLDLLIIADSKTLCMHNNPVGATGLGVFEYI